MWNFLKKKTGVENFSEEMKTAYDHSRYSVNTGESKIISIKLEEEGLAKDLYGELRRISGVRIELTDRAYSKREQDRIKKKYSYIQKSVPLGSGANFWQILDETKHAVIITAQFLWPWVIGHIAEDVDDKLWEKVKKVAIKSVQVVRRKKPAKNTVVLLVHHPEQIQHEIALILDEELTDEHVIEAFRLLPKAVQTLGDPIIPGPTLRAFRFESEKEILIAIDSLTIKQADA